MARLLQTPLDLNKKLDALHKAKGWETYREDYDAIMAVYEGCVCPVDESSLLACGDDTCGTAGGPPVVTLPVDAGTCYTIRVAGWDGAMGDGEMNIWIREL